MNGILTFLIGGSTYGVDAKLVREIASNPVWSPIPVGDGTIRGLMNLRGQVVTILDLRTIIQGEMHKTVEKAGACIVLKEPEDPDLLGFLVDEPGDIVMSIGEDVQLLDIRRIISER